MYLHLGEDTMVRDCDIIGIFDLEKTSTSQKTKDFLVSSSKNNIVTTISYEMPRSFIITKENNINKVYISQISVNTIKNRFTK